MRVLLINPRIPNGQPWIPLGLVYIAAYLKKFDIETKLIDSNFYDINKQFLSNLIWEFKPNLVGIGGFTVQFPDALKVGEIIKCIDKNLLLVYGGVHCTFKPEDGLKIGDICVIGEGERIFLKICREFKKYKNCKEILGPEPFIENLDEIPFPAYELLEMEKYSDLLITGERAISIMTGRGCPYNCIFCASPQLYKRRVRYHSLDYVIEHIKFLKDNYQLQNLRIMDDTFTLSARRVLEFCDKIEKHGFKLNMTCLTNVQNANLEFFKRMKEVGFSIIAFGIESGNNEILRKINKGITTQMAEKSVVLAKKAGLATECLFMIGNIGETKLTILDSIRFARKVNPPRSNSQNKTKYNWFQFATPFPGSKFYEISSQYGKVIAENWEEYHHQKPVFIPKGLNEASMIILRSHALKKCNKIGYIPYNLRVILKKITSYFSFVQ